MSPSRRIRVVVVDDSAVIRQLLSKVLSADFEIEVVGTASNGRLALRKIADLKPDLVTLDIEMPELSGLDTLVELRRDYPRMPVVMFSSHTQRGAEITFRAIELGASDYFLKPSGAGGIAGSIELLRQQLV